jgi:hypothetical protein
MPTRNTHFYFLLAQIRLGFFEIGSSVGERGFPLPDMEGVGYVLKSDA